MKHKKILLFLGITFFFLLIPQKLSALNLRFCQYGDLELTLPVTIGVSADFRQPFAPVSAYYDENEMYVNSAGDCSQFLPIPIYTYEIGYLKTVNYYYYYNSNDRVYVSNTLGNGTYREYDPIPPVITSFYKDSLEVPVGEKMELDKISLFISATDNLDGTVIPEIIYDSYSDNYHILGEYIITFKACDSSNNCTNFNQKIKTIDNIKPTISGNNHLFCYMSRPCNPNNFIFELKAIDNYYGDITSKIKLQSSNYQDNLPADYYATYVAVDYSNNESLPFKITITLVDDIPPTIEGPTIFNSQLSNPLSTKTILSNLIVDDNCDSQAYKNLYTIDDTYTPNQGKIGEYRLVVGTYDKYANESLPYIISIKVRDDIAPTIDGKNHYESYLSSPITLLTIKSNLIVLDNYDGNLFNKLEIIEDNYTNIKNTIGSFNIVFVVKDSSDNSSLPFNVEVVLYDDVAPVIQGINYYSTLVGEKLDINNIKLQLSANDNVDGDLSFKIELDSDSYTNNYALEGTYFVSFYVVDSSANFSNLFKVKIEVKADYSYLDNLDNSNIYLSTDEKKSLNDILDILNLNSEEFQSINVIEDSYTPSFNEAGTYPYSLEFEYKDYTKQIISINIITRDTSTTKEVIKEDTNKVETKKETFWNKIVSFFKNIFTKIINFFKRLFS